MSKTCLRVCSSSTKIFKLDRNPKQSCVRDKLRRNLQILVPELNTEPKLALICKTTSGIVEDDLEKLCVLGRGNYGIVYKVRHRLTSTIYALKIIQEEISSTNTTSPSLSQEVEILTITDSPFLVKCHGNFDAKVGEKAILMEYMEAGTLDTLVKNNGPFPESIIGHIAYQVLNGLNYLHARNIVHLDIKPANLLVNKDMKVKIGDFGVSKIIGHNNNLGSQGTNAYMSPERLDSETFGSEYPFAGDVWSLGVTLLELYVGHFPFFPAEKRVSWIEVLMEICFGDLEDVLPKDASEVFLSFIKCCLEREPSKRWTASQLLSHPFICMKRDPIPITLLGFT